MKKKMYKWGGHIENATIKMRQESMKWEGGMNV